MLNKVQADRPCQGKARATGREVIDGPFSESKELIGGYAVLELPSMEVAIAECSRYVEILGGTLEVDIRPLAEPEAVP